MCKEIVPNAMREHEISEIFSFLCLVNVKTYDREILNGIPDLILKCSGIQNFWYS
jgi:hypothetical protein